MKALVVLEMAGTVNALKRPLALLEKQGWELKYAADKVALSTLAKAGIECLDKADPHLAMTSFAPDVVVTGIAHPDGGIELGYAHASLDTGIPVAMYRDYSGISPWVGHLAQHPRVKELLHFLMFDQATAEAIRRQRWSYNNVQVVGSAYYDNLADPSAILSDRSDLRSKIGVSDDDLLIVFNSGADKARVLDGLEPVCAGLLGNPVASIVFAPSFHPKDPDAPYFETEQKGVYAARPSVYDSVIEKLEGKVRLIREPAIRNAISDSQKRIATADFIVMNWGSTDTWTAAFLGVPMLIPLTPLQQDSARQVLIEPSELDLLKIGAADAVYSKEGIEEYMLRLPADWPAIAERQRKAQGKIKPGRATEVIARAIADIATLHQKHAR